MRTLNPKFKNNHCQKKYHSYLKMFNIEVMYNNESDNDKTIIKSI